MYSNSISVHMAQALKTKDAHMTAHHAMRKLVFVDKLNWHLPEYDGSDLEKDAFDTHETIYAFGEFNGDLIYSARFLEAQTSMVLKLWPEAAHSLGMPEGTVEMSRFVLHSPSPPAYATRAMRDLLFHLLQEMKFTGVFATMDRLTMRLYVQRFNKAPMKQLVIADNIIAGYWKL